MLLKVRMAIMSHLSDAQYLIGLDTKVAKMHIDFAKLLLVMYDNVNDDVSSDELDEVWMNEIHNKPGIGLRYNA